jgi:hypothetical protein
VSTQDSIYKLWKFKALKLLAVSKNGTSELDKFDLLDLTKKNIFTYHIIDSPGVVHSIPYKIINRAIVWQLPKNDDNLVVQFKIVDLTPEDLKLILHLTYTFEGETRDKDVAELSFEAKK